MVRFFSFAQEHYRTWLSQHSPINSRWIKTLGLYPRSCFQLVVLLISAFDIVRVTSLYLSTCLFTILRTVVNCSLFRSGYTITRNSNTISDTTKTSHPPRACALQNSSLHHNRLGQGVQGNPSKNGHQHYWQKLKRIDSADKIGCFLITLLSLKYWTFEISLSTLTYLLGVLVILHFLLLFSKKLITHLSLYLIAVTSAILIGCLHIYIFSLQTEQFSRAAESTSFTGTVTSIAQKKDNYYQIMVNVEQIARHKIPWLAQPNVLFFWPLYLPLPKSGQRWRSVGKKTSIHGHVNSVGFDEDKYAASIKMSGKFWVKQAHLLSSHVTIRQQIYDQIQTRIQSLPNQRFLLALSFAQRDQITDHDWQLFRQSGLAHLMAISGLHIGLVFSLGWLIGRCIRCLLPVRLHSIHLPLYSAIFMATNYAWLAGWSIPTCRALILSILFSYGIFRPHYWPKWQTWLYMCCLFLILNPLAILSNSFWLSIGAATLVLISLSWLPLYIRRRPTTSHLPSKDHRCAIRHLAEDSLASKASPKTVAHQEPTAFLYVAATHQGKYDIQNAQFGNNDSIVENNPSNTSPPQEETVPLNTSYSIARDSMKKCSREVSSIEENLLVNDRSQQTGFSLTERFLVQLLSAKGRHMGIQFWQACIYRIYKLIYLQFFFSLDSCR